MPARLGFLCSLLMILEKYFNPLHIKIHNKTQEEHTTSLQNTWILVMLMLAKPHNISLVAMIVLQEHLIDKFVFRTCTKAISVYVITFYDIFMGTAAFFYQVCFTVKSVIFVLDLI